MAIYRLQANMNVDPADASEKLKAVNDHLPGWGLTLQQITVMAGAALIAVDGTIAPEDAEHVEVEPV